MTRSGDRIRRDDERVWAVIAATVRPLKGRSLPVPPAEPALAAPARKSRAPLPAAPASAVASKSAAQAAPPAPPRRPVAPRKPAAPAGIEPNRLHRIDKGREPLSAVLDLHGLDQDAARATLQAFVTARFAQHHRAVLIITGKGALGDGVLRRRVPEWLAEPPLRALIAGISEAHRRKGGEGALYVALRRNPNAGR